MNMDFLDFSIAVVNAVCTAMVKLSARHMNMLSINKPRISSGFIHPRLLNHVFINRPESSSICTSWLEATFTAMELQADRLVSAYTARPYYQVG